MALTATERALLTEARHLILTGREHYICCALASSIATPPQIAAFHRLQQYIHQRLGGCWCLERWQRENGFGPRSSAQSKQDRLDWIDWMLDQ